MVGAGTGLRQGEAFGLTVPHLHMLHRTLAVEQQLVTRSRAYASLGPPKTEASRRVIPLPDVVLKALARHFEEFPTTLELVGHVSASRNTSSRSSPLHRWHAACRQAGVLAYTFHDLRHYYASLLNRQGESVKVVQSRLGHASAQETLDTYSHLWPDSEHLTRRAVDAVLGGAAKRHRGEGTRRWAAQQALTLSLWSTSCGRSLFHGSLSISWKTLCPIW